MKKEYIIPTIQVKEIEVLAMTGASALDVTSTTGNPASTDAKADMLEFILDNM